MPKPPPPQTASASVSGRVVGRRAGGGGQHVRDHRLRGVLPVDQSRPSPGPPASAREPSPRRGPARPAAEVLAWPARCASASVMSPTNTSAELPGFHCAAGSRRVVARERARWCRQTAGPASRRDDRRRTRACRATRRRWRSDCSRPCASPSRAASSPRSTSAAGNDGRWTTSARIVERRPTIALEHLEADRALSRPDAAVERRRRDRRACSRSPAPLASWCRGRCPRRHAADARRLPAGSAMAPARVARANRDLRQVGRSTTKTSSPFGSLAVCTVGRDERPVGAERRLL